MSEQTTPAWRGSLGDAKEQTRETHSIAKRKKKTTARAADARSSGIGLA